jgi:DNA helicase-4
MSDRWGRSTGRAERQWQLVEQPDGMLLTVGGRPVELAGDDLTRLSTKRGWFRHALVVAGLPPEKLTGLCRQDLPEIDASVARLLARHRAMPAIAAALAWHDQARSLATEAVARGRWIARDSTAALRASRPGPATLATISASTGTLAALAAEERRAVEFLRIDLDQWVAVHNETILAAESREHESFFNTVESRPLTEEQRRAVVCMDNAVHVIASAGSGKTSVMVARAAYAIMRGFVPPERVLLLAFNKDAADELRERVASRLNALGLPSTGVNASTFHAFGLQVVAEATGRKPRAAPWLDAGQDVAMICRIVDELRDRSAKFAFEWDLFRLLYARPTTTPDGGEPDSWDRDKRLAGFRTANGETVKSEGERILADWLFYNGVKYQYEKPYSVPVADRQHSQYRPDFYYPDIDVWHEHWALDREGRPPTAFKGYAEAMRWKKELHKTHGTTLVETRWADIIDYSGLAALDQQLTAHGLELDWNPDRHVPGLKPLKHEDLARLMRSFMAHVKSNSLSRDALDSRVEGRMASPLVPRTRLFLDLYWQIHDVWQQKLQAEDAVDFEDMLVAAADHLERGTASSEYDLVMVDEFQDASQARARLTRALVSQPGRLLLAVGDDWQSINRFAGADISVMTEFESWFGSGPTLRLQTTFRCPRSICDVASQFVAKNPRQLSKEVVSAQAEYGKPIRLVHVAAGGVTRGIAEYLDELNAQVAAEADYAGGAVRRTVFVLGRYRFDRDLVPRKKWAHLDVKPKTIHSSKGLEADYVVLPNLTRGRFGFPSNIEDDPILDLAMADPDPYPHAEERRLFYVALTRARREVALVAMHGQESPFVVELIEDGSLVADDDGTTSAPVVCPKCRTGLLVERTGPCGQFLACSTFPRCDQKQKIAREVVADPTW